MRWRQLFGGVAVITAALVSTADPASAHGASGLNATNWEARARGVDEPNSGARVRMLDLGTHLELTTDGKRTIVVLGYSKEPYLRFDHDGVWINNRSPAGFLNRSVNPPSRVPNRFDETAPPQWRKLTARHTYRWHDHRTHGGSKDESRTWMVPILLDDAPSSITGTLRYVKPDPPRSALFVGVIGLGVGVAAMLVAPRATSIALAAVAGGLAVVLLIGQHRASTEPFGDQLGATLYSIGTLLGASVIVVAASRLRPARAAPAILLASVAIMVCGGLARIGWLTHSQLPTSLSYDVGTTAVMVTIIIGVILAAFAIRELLLPYPNDVAPSDC